MEHGEYLYLIGLGGQADWEEGRGAFYYITDQKGEKGLPVFTTAERAESYGQANLNTPEAHMDALEIIPLSHADLLTEGRYSIMRLGAEGVARVANTVEADYLIRDPRPGETQDILRRSS
jgi:hypothetical protein